jgi:general secretion pathway protein G
MTLDNSSLGPNVSVAGVSVPSFGQRKVQTRLRLRDGESNLLAGLLREDERKSLTGFPGAIHVPILKQLFSANDTSIAQTDIVMLLTPHIIRTSGLTEQDLRPIYIGSAQNRTRGPPPLIAGAPEPEAPSPGAAPAPAPGVPPGVMPGPGGTMVAPPPGSTPVPGTVVVPPQPPPAAPPQPPAVPPPPSSAAAPTPAPAPVEPPITVPGVGLAQVILSPPATTFRVGAGPYTVPISIVNVSRLSTVSLTLTFDPALLRVRSVQEGSFMRSAGANAAFTQQIAPGRVDITITRAGDATGASCTGLLAAVLFDAVAPVNATLTLSGAGSGPGDRHTAVPAGDARDSNSGRRPRRNRSRLNHEDTKSTKARRKASCPRLKTRRLYLRRLLVVDHHRHPGSAVMPLAKVTATRQREAQLRRELREIRTAIDKYKDAADLGLISPLELKIGNEGYPASLETLVEGVAVPNDATGRKLKFLRRVPVDPMTHSNEWGLRSYQDEPAATRWGGQNVFDVYTKFEGTGLDGSKYRDW